MSRRPAGGDRSWPDELEVEPASSVRRSQICQTLLVPGIRHLSFDPPPLLSLSLSPLSLPRSLSLSLSLSLLALNDYY